jgi:hypothetical protein
LIFIARQISKRRLRRVDRSPSRGSVLMQKSSSHPLRKSLGIYAPGSFLSTLRHTILQNHQPQRCEAQKSLQIS